MRALKNCLFCHSGLDPESREWLKILDSGACPGLRSGIRRNDKRANFPALFKGLKMYMHINGMIVSSLTITWDLFQMISTFKISFDLFVILTRSLILIPAIQMTDSPSTRRGMFFLFI